MFVTSRCRSSNDNNGKRVDNNTTTSSSSSSIRGEQSVTHNNQGSLSSQESSVSGELSSRLASTRMLTENNSSHGNASINPDTTSIHLPLHQQNQIHDATNNFAPKVRTSGAVSPLLPAKTINQCQNSHQNTLNNPTSQPTQTPEEGKMPPPPSLPLSVNNIIDSTILQASNQSGFDLYHDRVHKQRQANDDDTDFETSTYVAPQITSSSFDSLSNYRIQKIAKTDYSDHGSHQQSSRQRAIEQQQQQQMQQQQNVVKRITLECKQLDNKIRQNDAIQTHQNTHTDTTNGSNVNAFITDAPPNNVSDFSKDGTLHQQLVNNGNQNTNTNTLTMDQNLNNNNNNSTSNQQNCSSNAQPAQRKVNAPKGLLGAIMEGQIAAATQQQQQYTATNVNNNNMQTSPSQSQLQIQLQQLIQQQQQQALLQQQQQLQQMSQLQLSQVLQQQQQLPLQNLISTNHINNIVANLNTTNVNTNNTHSNRGKCLTAPSEAAANDGCDNIEGNLIVHENDIIALPSQNIQSLDTAVNADNTAHKKVNNNSSSNWEGYKVIELLGQGTFAQVFKCEHLQSNQTVAVKIVKNKPAYTRQAAIEIDIFRELQNQKGNSTGSKFASNKNNNQNLSPRTTSRLDPSEYMVQLLYYFMYQSHLCLVFELLGLNLYEVLKKRQFRGLPLQMVQRIIRESIEGIQELALKNVVHCDLKPENILVGSDAAVKDMLVAGLGRKNDGQSGVSQCVTPSDCGTNTQRIDSFDNLSNFAAGYKRLVKLIDLGSACFEGHTAHTYIQSRFYRSPEVLMGIPYDAAIDMWSIGCVAAELYLGLPILPGVQEHDQVSRIIEMIGDMPEWMLEFGAKSSKFFHRRDRQSNIPSSFGHLSSLAAVATTPQWQVKSLKEYISSLSQSEVQQKGGVEKLEKPPGNRYFKQKKLADILILHSHTSSREEKELLPAFVHFLYGLLDPDPWKRWTAAQALEHPFLTGNLSALRNRNPQVAADSNCNQANVLLTVAWTAPHDPLIEKRKLATVQLLQKTQLASRYTMFEQLNEKPLKTNDQYFNAQGNQFVEQSLSMRNSFSYDQNNPSSLLTAALNSPLTNSTINVNAGYSNLSQLLHNPNATTGSVNLLDLYNPIEQPRNIITSDSVETNQYLSQFLQAQSFSSFHNNSMRNLMQGDFASALQRPGVIPRAYEESLPFDSNSNLSNNINDVFASQFLPSNNVDALRNQLQRYTGVGSMPHIPLDRQMDENIVVGQAHAVSNAASNVAYNDSTSIDLASLYQSLTPYSKQTSKAGVSSSQQQQQQHLSPNSLQSGQPVNTLNPLNAIPYPIAPPIHSSQQNIQQPLYFTQTGANEGVYYTTDVATGQPMLLQPIGTVVNSLVTEPVQIPYVNAVPNNTGSYISQLQNPQNLNSINHDNSQLNASQPNNFSLTPQQIQQLLMQQDSTNGNMQQFHQTNIPRPFNSTSSLNQHSWR